MVRDEIVGYVIAQYDYKNSSSIIKVVCENNKYSIFGKNFKNVKNSNLIFENRFCKIKMLCEIENNILKKISNVRLLNFEDKLYNIDINFYLNLISKIILSDSKYNKQYYELFDYTIKSINQKNCYNFYFLWLIFRFRNSFYINLNECFICKNKSNITGFDIKGGFLCNNCCELNYDLNLLKIFKKVMQFDFEFILNSKVNEFIINEILNYYFENEGLLLK